MALSEFGIIERFFTRPCKNPASRLGVGDDCALLTVPAGYQLAVTSDTMVENVHFFTSANPEWLGYKLLAVNLSDLAAMGAQPVAVTLALTMPTVDDAWLQAFARGFWQLADRYSVDLVGGDTTSGPLAMTVQAMGIVPAGKALLRSTAKPGDLVYVTGTLGDAGLALKILQGNYSAEAIDALRRFHQPDPRIDEGLVISKFANACIDVSDGLVSDLGHILRNSGVGACLNWEDLQFSSAVIEYIKQTQDWTMPLVNGDDYELCFTVSPGKTELLNASLDRHNFHCNCIGVIEQKPGLRLKKAGLSEDLAITGYEHFR